MNSWLDPGSLSSHTAEALIDRVAAARERVWLASPFVSDNFAKRICDRLPRDPKLELRLIVALNGSGVESGTLELAALRRLRKAGFVLGNVTNLHAKVSIVDSDWGLVGSGNLTKAGQNATNVELGVVLYPQQHAQARSMFEAWWHDAERIEPGDIAAFERWRKSLPSKKSYPPPPKHGKPIRVPDHEGEHERGDITEHTQFWAKALYHRPALDDPNWWRTMTRINDGPRENKGGPRYQVDDLVVIYLQGWRCCPAIVQVADVARHDRKKSNEGIPKEDWDRWPWLTPIRRISSVPLEQGFAPEVIRLNPMSLRNGRARLTREQFEIAEARLSR